MTKSFKYPIEIFLLVALIVSVPLLESPKGILAVICPCVWLYNRVREKSYGGPWDGWDSLILLWIASGYVVAFFAGLHYREWSGAYDVVRYGLILWAIKRSGYGQRELKWLLIAISISTSIALAGGLWNLFITRTSHTLQLHSVGQVNHSAIYMVISYGALLSATLSFWKNSQTWLKAAACLLTIIFAGAVFLSASRAAVGVMLMLTFILGLVWLRRSRFPLIILTSILIITSGAAFLTQVRVVEKQERHMGVDTILNHREGIWNSALVAWERFPLLGVGMNNYSQITMERVESWLTTLQKPYIASEYSGNSHAHSLYLNALAERGLFGFSVLLAVLLYWLYSLVRWRPKGGDEDIAWAVWGAACSAWLVTVGVGFVNTTLHHEHAILSAILLGMWLAYLRLKHSSVALVSA